MALRGQQWAWESENRRWCSVLTDGQASHPTDKELQTCNATVRLQTMSWSHVIMIVIRWTMTLTPCTLLPSVAVLDSWSLWYPPRTEEQNWKVTKPMSYAYLLPHTHPKYPLQDVFWSDQQNGPSAAACGGIWPLSNSTDEYVFSSLERPGKWLDDDDPEVIPMVPGDAQYFYSLNYVVLGGNRFRVKRKNLKCVNGT